MAEEELTPEGIPPTGPWPIQKQEKTQKEKEDLDEREPDWDDNEDPPKDPPPKSVADHDYTRTEVTLLIIVLWISFGTILTVMAKYHQQ